MKIELRPAKREDGTLCFVPYCCKISSLVTVFPNGVVRWLCPKCGHVLYLRQGESYVERVKGFSP